MFGVTRLTDKFLSTTNNMQRVQHSLLLSVLKSSCHCVVISSFCCYCVVLLFVLFCYYGVVLCIDCAYCNTATGC